MNRPTNRVLAEEADAQVGLGHAAVKRFD